MAEAPEEGTEVAERRVSIGVRAFGGVQGEGGEVNPVLGGGLLGSVEVWKHLEIEGSVLLASNNQPRPFFVAELITKWVFERERRFAPHLTLGPLVSVDFTDPAQVSGGLVAGGGVTWWTRPALGWLTDLNYRLMAGSEIGHVVTLALGVAFKVF